MNIEQQIDAMIDELADNPEEVKAALDRVRRESALVDALHRARLDAGLSQRELADAAGLSHAKVCRMESGEDADLKIGEINKYIAPLGLTASLMLDDETKPASVRIKRMVIAIGDLLDKLAKLAEKDPEDRSFIDGINQFRGEVLFNFMLRYAGTQPRITIAPPPRRTAPAPAAAPADALATALP